MSQKVQKILQSSYIFDDGQRDGFYGLSKITRKESGAAPQNPIMIVFDYFTHGSGNNFTGVASYPMDFPIIRRNTSL